MAWIESHDELPTHPKTRKAARKLGVGAPQVIGHLHVLWYWCLTHRPDGRLDGMDSDDVADAAGWPDEGETFVKAMVTSGWLDDDNGTLAVHDWWDGAGKTIRRRKFATERQRRARDTSDSDEQVTEESHGSHADVTRDTQTSHGADSDSDSDKGQEPPPGGNGKPPFATTLANELKADHGWKPPDGATTYQSFQALQCEALERFPEAKHRSITLGLIAGYVDRCGATLTPEARSHTARLVSKHPATAVLHAWDQALEWGAGINGDYAKDPLAMSKYAAAILGGKDKA
jgi:hypothetical protein